MKKDFWKSKTFWAAVLIAAGSVGQYLAGNIDVATLLTQASAALGVFGIRDALN